MSGGDKASDRWMVEEELRALSTDYATAVDDRDGERLAGLFVGDGALVVPRYPEDLRPVVTRSGEELRRLPEGLKRYQRTFHQLTNHRYEVAGSLASGEVLCVAHHLSAGTAGPGIDTVWFIRYRDDCRRTDTGWRFVRRELHLQWVEDRPVGMVGPASHGADDGTP